ncbi:MAG: PDZ domain-containing protein [Verrucomicrobiota bacterium JB023]|nr:PDZ domain-containing protein [Verrucomicrobiota bacterium JB023]
MKNVLITLCALALGCPLSAQSLEAPFRRKGDEVRNSFEEIREDLQKCSAVLYTQRLAQGYGVVLSADGYILAKASEVDAMDEELTIMVDRKRFTEVERVATDQNWDVTLLKVPGEGLSPATWQDEEPELGTMVFSNSGTGRFKRRAQLGVISAKAREIGGEGLAALGVGLDMEAEELVVESVADGSGAAEAGVHEEDVIVSLNGEKLGKPEEFMDVLRDLLPGDEVTLGLRRNGEEMELVVTMSVRAEIYPEQLTRNDMMSGEFSKRRTNFPRVIQHDTPMAQRTVGGPLLNMRGECVGMNIAFASREASYAIPAKEVQALFAKLKGE